MDETRKGQTGSGAAQGSGSDTVSAAKIAGGTGAGATGQSAQPGGGSSPLGSGAQSATLASHTSRPMGGTAQSGSAQSGSQQGSGSSQGGMSDSARQAAQDATERATTMARDTADWASDAYESGSRQLSDMGRRSLEAGRQSGQTVQRFVSENPVLVGVVGLAAGLLLGALLPRSRQEDRTFGRWADEVRDQGWRYARDMTQRGRDYVEHAFAEDESDSDFDSPGQNRQRDDQRRSGPSGRYQNH